MRFSEAVKRKLADKNLKTTDLARSTGYSYQYVSDLLKGKRRWNEESMTKVSDALGFDLELKFVPKKENV